MFKPLPCAVAGTLAMYDVLQAHGEVLAAVAITAILKVALILLNCGLTLITDTP